MTEQHPHGPWTRRVAMARRYGLALGLIGFGALGQSVIDQTSRLPAVVAAAKAVPQLAAALDSKQQELDVVKCQAWLVNCANAHRGRRQDEQ